MIVLDEQISRESIRRSFRWYPGGVLPLKELRPGTIVLDDVVSVLLRRRSDPTFVTLNVSDFWRRIPPDQRYCVICVAILQGEAEHVSSFVRGLLRMPGLTSKAQRMGKVVLATPARAWYYDQTDPRPQALEGWAAPGAPYRG